MKILFVCLGNICRSPAAEGVFTELAKEHGIFAKLTIDSAGTSGHHEGERADHRMRKFAKKRGIELTSLSRPVRADMDFQDFDYILAMDKNNLRDLQTMNPNENFASKIHLMSNFAKDRSEIEVPDPYFGGDSGFELVLDILEDSCLGLIEKIKQEIS